MAPLTSGRVTIAVSAVYQAKVLCATLCPKCLNLSSWRYNLQKKSALVAGSGFTFFSLLLFGSFQQEGYGKWLPVCTFIILRAGRD